MADDYREKEAITRKAIFVAVRQYMARIEANLMSKRGEGVNFRKVATGHQFLWTGCGTLFVGDVPVFRCAKVDESHAVVLENYMPTPREYEKAGTTLSLGGRDWVIQID